MITTLMTENFDDSIKNGTCFVKFTSPTCGPCRQYAKTYDLFAEQNTTVKCFTIDATENLDIASKFNIRQVPVTIVFKDGVVKNTLNGVQSVDQLEENI